MSIANGPGEARIGGMAEDAGFSTGYSVPSNHDLAARSGTIDMISAVGDRVHVEAVILVNDVECVLSGTAELFTR